MTNNNKDYKRCTLAHKLMFEAMGMLKLQAFFIWLVEHHNIQPHECAEIELKCHRVQDYMRMISASGEQHEGKSGTLFWCI